MWYPPRYPINGPLSISSAVLAFVFSACSLNDAPGGGNYLQIQGSVDLMSYSRVLITVGDTLGHGLDTVYNDSLSSLSRLNHLSADKYTGGAARIQIQGFQGANLAYNETRIYDGRTQKVIALDISKPEPGALVVASIPTSESLTYSPAFTTFPSDTLLSIRDSLTFEAEAFDRDGDLASYAWYCSDKVARADSGTLSGYRQKIHFGKKFNEVGSFTCSLHLWDDKGKFSQATDSIRIILDPPTADAGNDTTVNVGNLINLHARGWDGIGPIVSRSWKIGDKDFISIKQQETQISAPLIPGGLICILKVTDSDSLSAFDTLMVSVLKLP